MAVTISFQLSQDISALAPDATVAWLFPGQGSQEVGMGRDLCEGSPAARRLFQRADEVLGFPLSRLCFQGPEEELRKTANAQPAILVTSLACLAAALEMGRLDGRPAYMAGHSLGEYAALVAAGALEFEGALLLVRERARLMQQASQSQPGGMAAILGLDLATVQALCREAGTTVANFNGPSHLVVGGPLEAVQRASELAQQRGGRAVRLNVGGAFHTPLMGPAGPAFGSAVEGVALRHPRIPVFANASAQPLDTSQAVRDELKRQILAPVLWHQTMEGMLAAGVRRFVEIGPGRVLSGLAKRLDGVEALSLNSLASLSP